MRLDVPLYNHFLLLFCSLEHSEPLHHGRRLLACSFPVEMPELVQPPSRDRFRQLCLSGDGLVIVRVPGWHPVFSVNLLELIELWHIRELAEQLARVLARCISCWCACAWELCRPQNVAIEDVTNRASGQQHPNGASGLSSRR